MNAPAPPKRENRARAGRGFPKLQQWTTYLVIRLSQIGTPRIRRCVCCNTHITNINLGGNNGRFSVDGRPLLPGVRGLSDAAIAQA
jgi:hypothetical protein